MSPTPSKRRPGKARQPRRPRSTDGPPSIDGVFAAAYRSARGLGATVDPLEAETLASSLLAMWNQPLIGERDPVEFFGTRFVAYLAAKRSADSLALLLALASIGPESTAREARAAAMRMRLTRVAAPSWADLPMTGRFTRAWSSTDPYGDQDILVAEFERDAFPPYSTSALIDHNLRGIVKDLFVTADPAGLRADWSQNALMPIVEVTPQEYADRISRAMEAEEALAPSPDTQEARYLYPLVRARLRDLPRAQPIPAARVSAAARKRLLKAFQRSEEGLALGRDAELAEHFIDYAADQGSGDPLRWSPSVVELCLLDWLPRKVTLDDESVTRIPDVLRAWVRFAGGRKGLAGENVAATVGALDEFEAEYRGAMRDSSRFGPAKSIVSAMLAEGVPLTDQASLDAWLEGFNARPQEERDRVLGHLAMPPLPPDRGR